MLTATGAPVRAHVLHQCLQRGHLTASSGMCWLCDGGVFLCVVCGQAEASLSVACPGPCAARAKIQKE
jgi:hypothetical protein